jgi:phosphoribosylaminoimidazole-succinocarboxamide synthase
MVNSQKFERPLFTPATKAKSGHDENIDEARGREILGDEGFEQVRAQSLSIYERASRMAAERGIIIADTKFEFGLVDGEWILVDELLTPDSSRYWDAQRYQPGREQDSMDKQILRNYLATLDWDKSYPPPQLDPAILERTYEAYLEIFRRLFPERARECGA